MSTITDFPGKSTPRVGAAFARLYDVQQQIIAAAGGRPIDLLLWEFLFAAFLEMHTASIMDHVDRVEAIVKAKEKSQ